METLRQKLNDTRDRALYRITYSKFGDHYIFAYDPQDALKKIRNPLF